MASVFLSYDHEDAGRAAPIAGALEMAGHSVWWDRHIHGGAEYNSEIESAVERADAVVVLWSERSIRSAWVRDEAAEGRDRGKLVPVLIDRAKPPMGFRQFQTIDLSAWNGRTAPPKIPELLHSVARIADGASVAPAEAHAPATTQQKSQIPLHWTAVAVAVTVAAAALLFWQPWKGASSAAVAAVVPANASPPSQELARDLFAQLGELETSRGKVLELVGGERRKDANLVFEVEGRTEGRSSRANIVLLDGINGAVLWSKAFQRPAEETGDLRQELGYTAAQVLGCALEAHPGSRPLLKPAMLKLYLKGCAELADPAEESFAALGPLFRQIVEAAPNFEGAWSRLLTVEGWAQVSATPESRAQLERDISSARKVNPQLAAAYAAEAGLLPYGRWAERLAILDRGIANNAEDTWLLQMRADLLTAVGRMRDAVDDSRAAKRIAPLSPRVRARYVLALAQAGQLDAALQELQDAERLWPGSSNVAAAKFGFHLRFGDPRTALQFIRSGTLSADWAQGESFVLARIESTPANIRRALEDARMAYEQEPLYFQHYVQTLSIFDREEELLALLMRVPLDQAQWVTDVTFRPAARELWHDRRALAYAKRVGLLHYWRSSGKWPDYCFERDLPYDCKKEAAKLAA